MEWQPVAWRDNARSDIHAASRSSHMTPALPHTPHNDSSACRSDPEADLLAAESCFAHLARFFAELASYRAFELLRGQRGRTDYMLTKQARVIAMTCTHAALTRAALLELRFAYDTVVMEEAAQVTEVETLLPLLLQQRGHEDNVVAAAEGGGAGAAASTAEPRLQRLILIGDHHQLPPVVQNMALQKFAHLDQSLFAR
jgi:intron-binding protein aquarius